MSDDSHNVFSTACEDPLPWCHLVFCQACFSTAAILHFSSACSNSVNFLQFSDLSMSIVLVSLFQTCFKQRWGRYQPVPRTDEPPESSRVIWCTCPSWCCWRRAYRMGNRGWVKTTALVSQSDQLMVRMCLRQRNWKMLMCLSLD